MDEFGAEKSKPADHERKPSGDDFLKKPHQISKTQGQYYNSSSLLESSHVTCGESEATVDKKCLAVESESEETHTQDHFETLNSNECRAHLFSSDFPTPVQASKFRRLRQLYVFLTISITSSTKTDPKVNAIYNFLIRSDLPGVGKKPVIAAITGKGIHAHRLIAIVNKAKQRIMLEDRKWWQYNHLHDEIVYLKRPKRDTCAQLPGAGLEGNTKVPQETARCCNDDAASTDNEKAFHSLESGPRRVFDAGKESRKFRRLPLITIFLSTVPVTELGQFFEYVIQYVVFFVVALRKVFLPLSSAISVRV